MKKFCMLLVILILIPVFAFSVPVAITWEWMLEDPDVTAFRYQLDGEADDNWTTIPSDQTTVTFEDLDGSREYTLYLQQSYDEMNWSASAMSTAAPIIPDVPSIAEPVFEAEEVVEEAPAEETAVIGGADGPTAIVVAEEAAPVEAPAEEAAAEEVVPVEEEVAEEVLPVEETVVEEVLPVEEEVVSEEAPAVEEAPVEEAAAEEVAPVEEVVVEEAPAAEVAAPVKEKKSVVRNFSFAMDLGLGLGTSVNKMDNMQSQFLFDANLNLDFNNIIAMGDHAGLGLRLGGGVLVDNDWKGQFSGITQIIPGFKKWTAYPKAQTGLIFNFQFGKFLMNLGGTFDFYFPLNDPAKKVEFGYGAFFDIGGQITDHFRLMVEASANQIGLKVPDFKTMPYTGKVLFGVTF